MEYIKLLLRKLFEIQEQSTNIFLERWSIEGNVVFVTMSKVSKTGSKLKVKPILYLGQRNQVKQIDDIVSNIIEVYELKPVENGVPVSNQ